MPNVLAIVAHPDDIEFIMAGTLLQLALRGWTVHYMNVANGSCGSMSMDAESISRIRLEESRRAAAIIPAVFYPPICDDMGIYYDAKTLAKVASVVRLANPTIVLTHSPQDYMEDHEVTCRLSVGSAFVKSMPNFATDPPTAPIGGPVAIYHAQPHGNQTPLGQPVFPTTLVNVSPVLERKIEMLKCHASQEGWLDETQMISSFVASMKACALEMGKLSKRFQEAEGFRRHLHLGYCDSTFHPLKDALGQDVIDL